MLPGKINSVENIFEAVEEHRPRRVVLPSEALDEVLSMPKDPRRLVWLYQPGASIDMEARADALRRGAAGFVGWPLRLSDIVKRARQPQKGEGGLPYRAMVFEGGMSERALRVLDSRLVLWAARINIKMQHLLADAELGV